MFTVVPLCPFASFSVNGKTVSFNEFWLLGAGPTMFITGILLSISGIGILKYKIWGRNMFFYTLFAVSTIPYFFMAKSLEDLKILPFSLFFVFIVYIYLYSNRKVSHYFGIEKSKN
ncbi:MAG: hypothetical protein JW871_04010 [Endomicrobiales bacterium]|nr:hypothetical protein [Endomicrobiales bacterium]